MRRPKRYSTFLTTFCDASDSGQPAGSSSTAAARKEALILLFFWTEAKNFRPRLSSNRVCCRSSISMRLSRQRHELENVW
ncbi:hypothetical protein KCP78_23390 [Salmonella enterica subsp. enterica]|nr:hypothetical protein KCP78_23390 [Salmonella enterica subsp. enterica]